ncbi:MAG TPA: phosphate regulon sensor histidine kinase PhoR [Burkholderiaceae bacterium]|nr:phosphate regulon sensor histidine kinase PhoR [Burkholderiaceae bacterium]
MLPITFRRFMRPVLFKLVLIALVASLAGQAWGARVAWMTASALLLLYVLGFVVAVYRTIRWLEASQRRDAVEAPVGEWNSIAAVLYKARKTEAAYRAELDRSVTQLREVLERMPDGVVIVDASMLIQWLNPMAEQHLGLARKDVGLRLTNLVREPAFIDALTASGDSVASVPVRLKTGRVVVLQTIPFSPTQSLIVTRDVSEADRLDTMRRDFIANVSHELRTPLTVLAGFLELASPSAPISVQHLELMRTEALRMQRLIDDLLVLSRLESTAAPSQEDHVALAPLVQRAVDLARALSAGRHEIRIEPMPADLRGAEREIESALTNLVTNAVRYTPAGGKISVRGELDDEGIAIVVQDNGVGIAAEHIPRLTERFYRVDKSRSRDTGGTGLGLAIVKHVVLRHQGRLDVSSKLGEGSEFRLWFPRQRVLLQEPAREREPLVVS